MRMTDLRTTGLRFLFLAISALMEVNLSAGDVTVNSIDALQKAASNAKSGDVVILDDGTYNKGFKLSGKGTREKPIIIRAKTVGGVDMQAGVSLKGEFITLQGFKFSGKGGVSISGRGHRLTRCHMINVQSGQWVQVSDNSSEVEVDHCLFEKKENNKKLSRGCQLLRITVRNKGERHHIHHNHFRDVPKGKAGNGFETVQIITRGNPFDPKSGDNGTIVEYNLFERCNGESEIISMKSSGNFIRKNTFRACRGGLVLRHGHRNVASENIFFGDGETGSSGIRLQGKDQVVVNNVLIGLGRSAIAMMDGTKDSLYVRVERAIIAHNTVSGSKAMSVGHNHSKHPVGTPPKDCVIVGNVFTYTGDKEDAKVIEFVKGDEPANWTWADNVVQGNLGISPRAGISLGDPKLATSKSGMFLPTKGTPSSRHVFKDVKALDADLLGATRKGGRTLGAIQFPLGTITPAPLTEKEVGPNSPTANK